MDIAALWESYKHAIRPGGWLRSVMIAIGVLTMLFVIYADRLADLLFPVAPPG